MPVFTGRPWGQNGCVDENNQQKIYNRNRKEFYLSQTEDHSTEDSLSDYSEKLLQRSMIFSNFLFVYRILFFFPSSSFFFFFFTGMPSSWGSSQAMGWNQSCSCQPTPQPQQRRTQTHLWPTMTTAHGSLTILARAGIEATSSGTLQLQLRFLIHWATTGTPQHNFISFRNKEHQTSQEYIP